MAVVVFDYAVWTTRFPELASVSQAQATLFFNEACLLLDNTDNSPVRNVNARTVYLNLLTAHVAFLNATIDGIAPSDLVGRITSVSEGSVEVGASQLDLGQGAGYYEQSRYGTEYWQLTEQYRRAKYIVGPNVRFNRMVNSFPYRFLR